MCVAVARVGEHEWPPFLKSNVLPGHKSASFIHGYIYHLFISNVVTRALGARYENEALS